MSQGCTGNCGGCSNKGHKDEAGLIPQPPAPPNTQAWTPDLTDGACETHPLKRVHHEGCADPAQPLPSIVMPAGLSVASKTLVVNVANALAKALDDANNKHQYGDSWLSADWYISCVDRVRSCLQRNDVVDAIAFLAFMRHHNWPTGPVVAPEHTNGHSVECLYAYALSRLGLNDSEQLRILFWDMYNVLQYEKDSDIMIPPPGPADVPESCPACHAAQGDTPSARSKCNQSVYDNGLSVGLFDIPKESADAIVAALTRALGVKFDWHYIAGRVHLKALLAFRPAHVNNDTIRRVFLENGFKIQEGETDLKPYVYAAVHDLLKQADFVVAHKDGN